MQERKNDSIECGVKNLYLFTKFIFQLYRNKNFIRTDFYILYTLEGKLRPAEQG